MTEAILDSMPSRFDAVITARIEKPDQPIGCTQTAATNIKYLRFGT